MGNHEGTKKKREERGEGEMEENRRSGETTKVRKHERKRERGERGDDRRKWEPRRLENTKGSGREG